MMTSRFPAYCFKIEGTGHFSFSDVPYLIPSVLTMFGGGGNNLERPLQVDPVKLHFDVY